MPASVRLSPEEAWGVVERSHTGIFTTLRRDGTPIALPVWFAVRDRHLYIAAPSSTKKLARIARNPRASFLVEHGRRWEELVAVHLTGWCEVVTDTELIGDIDKRLDERYSAFRSEPSKLPARTAAHYAQRTLIRFTPDERILSWDNSRIPLSG